MEQLRENFLLIAGTGQNVGKTLFACKIIESISKNIPVTSIKISPHFHEINSDDDLLIQNDKFQIIREKNVTGSKDSNRLLSAGSTIVYYIQVKDDFLPEALKYLDQHINDHSAIICESGGLREIIKPGVFLMMNKKDNPSMKPRSEKYKHLADLWIEFDGEKFNHSAKDIIFNNQKWSIKN